MSTPDNQNPPPETDILESDPNGNNPDGLAGDMGISSERTGPMEGAAGVGTHGTRHTDRLERPDDADVPPEQSPQAATVEENPAEVPSHSSDPAKHPGHSHG